MPLGHFIVLEGIDGAGTTTQLHRLAAWLRAEGHSVHATFEPSAGPIGQQIRRILRSEERKPPDDAIALLFAADRLDHLAAEVEPHVAAGTHVLCDRYVGSSLAYQGSHSEPAWVGTINGHARTPDITLYVRVDADTALARIGLRDGERRELFEQRDVLQRIAAAYDRVYGAGGLHAEVIDGTLDADRVFEACRGVISLLLTRPREAR